MTPDRWLGIAALALGLLLGGVGGRVSYAKVSDRRPVCGTCHHDQTRLEARADTAPHDTAFAANCHSCHVIPVRAYADALAHGLGVEAPASIAEMDDPVLGGQTCLACHVARGRGAITCERCHVDGTLEPKLNENCSACHTQHPNAPHDQQPCRDCHVDAALDPVHRTEALMHQKLEGL